MILTGFTDDVSAGKLLIPPITDMDLAISETIAIPDQEVIAEPLISPSEMSTMNRLGGTEWFAQMMNHDSLPSIPIQGVLKHEDRVFSWPVLEISKAGQRESSSCCWGSQIQKHDDSGHGSKEATQNDLGSSRNRCL